MTRGARFTARRAEGRSELMARPWELRATSDDICRLDLKRVKSDRRSRNKLGDEARRSQSSHILAFS